MVHGKISCYNIIFNKLAMKNQQVKIISANTPNALFRHKKRPRSEMVGTRPMT